MRRHRGDVGSERFTTRLIQHAVVGPRLPRGRKGFGSTDEHDGIAAPAGNSANRADQIHSIS